jgi:hypothetical protein
MKQDRKLCIANILGRYCALYDEKLVIDQIRRKQNIGVPHLVTLRY